MRHIDVLRESASEARRRWPFRIDAWVVLPDHLHCLWTLPEGNADFAKRRFWENAIRDDRDFGCHMDYIHFNPVKHGYVAGLPTGRSRPFAASSSEVFTRPTGAERTKIQQRRVE